MATQHEVPSTPRTMHWGAFDANLAPVIEVDSGDRVTLDCLCGEPSVVPEGGDFHILPELLEVYREVERPLPGHLMTGPVAVRGAKPGDVLEIRILDVALRQDWGYSRIRPLGGTLPDDFDVNWLRHIRLDGERMVGITPWGMELPLKPFFGVLGVAPPEHWGMITSIIPRQHGGNLDLKELVAGTTLYLPVFNEGALFSAGDGHAAQGDGEVCSTAIETSLRGTFELHLRTDMALDGPQAETPSHYITLGMDVDLDKAARQALRAMIALIQDKAGITREEAYSLCSLAADLRVTQLVNLNKGIHAMLPKSLLGG
ncbi:MAG: acetamidase/formamidase family protein [Rhodospirillales bacterium]|nr:acetamidase/formamidase family protein [Rhodospirillales bacterium]MDP7651363.1 acetamidase/formamidase family protein [Rhodospirillales bacterium]HJO97644.1 acetamidase/formamidase family protein [Rhodospirillales bacterium]